MKQAWPSACWPSGCWGAETTLGLTRAYRSILQSLGEGMATAPWCEITTDDYHWRTHADPHSEDAWIAQAARIRDLLQRQIDGEFRLRLVLREAVDLKSGAKRDPDQIWDYDMGATTITGAAEIVIEKKTGLRQVVQLARSGTKARKRGRMARRRSDPSGSILGIMQLHFTHGEQSCASLRSSHDLPGLLRVRSITEPAL